MALQKAGGFVVSTANDGVTGLNKARSEKPSFIVLDLMLPKMPGLEVCKILKGDSATRHIPIMMLTAKAEEMDRIVGLEFGADDYVTKPFSPVKWRCGFTLSSAASEPKQADEHLSVGPITVDPVRHEVSVNGKAD